MKTKVKTKIRVNPPGPKSRKELKRLKKYVGPGNYMGLYGITLSDGFGSYVVDLDGNTYLDCLTGASANVLGYSQSDLVLDAGKVDARIQHTCFGYSLNVPALDLAELLAGLLPGTDSGKVMLGLSGSDSSGGAIKAARAYTGKQGIIHFKNSYHGSTGLSQQASDFGKLNDGIYGSNSSFYEVPSPYPTTAAQAEDALADIAFILRWKKIAAIIVEPIQGDAGVHVPAPGFMRQVRDLTRKFGALMIVDEVQAGMGRSGYFWAIEHEGIDPDLIVTGKGLAGGFAPISAVIAKPEILQCLGPAQHVFTFGGHPASARFASRVVKRVIAQKLEVNSRVVGELLLHKLREMQLSFPDVIADVRGRGLMIGVEIAERSLGSADKTLAAKIFATRCTELGIYVGFFGAKSEVVRIEPPLILKQREALHIAKIMERVAEEVKNDSVPKRTIKNVLKYAQGLSEGG